MAKSGTVLLGPWGGQGGNPWSHTVIGSISNIFITHDANGVNSIRFTSKDGNGAMYHSELFGVANGMEKEIKIDIKVEKLISMEGSVGTYNLVKRVTSLGFTTSRVKHEPVGTGKKESEFSCLLINDPFAGFHGHSSTILNSIGVSVVVKTVELVGPWPASAGGAPWNYTSRGPICQISITYDDDIVHSLQFSSRDADRFLHKSNIIGSTEDGSKTSKIKIDTKLQKIIGISGAYGSYGGKTLVKSITFITDNLRSFGPFGTENDEDTPFSYSVQGDEVIGGFHGVAGSLIDSIGVYIQSSKFSAKVGPFSASGSGKLWNYEPKGLISRIFLSHEGALDALRFESIDENGIKHTSEICGEEIGPDRYRIDIDKDDKLTGISGAVASYVNTLFISGVYIYTQNKNVYGPFGSGGKGKGSQFSFHVKDGYISGFYGMSTSGVHAIGIYVKPTT